ncbi:hypothetical protein GMDG_02072 [Pseudogymnoascus destructans 20631-21]|uniref:Myb-like domain-containing protein n=1 Tax=Pseudogymnoascus destructans (strain ATCC MYA-4855 / 20631-21) TaxID=658429 RepID=L8G0N4_PSED2|nr:hypothetical protein GMDG_02072 [Pseudogymnoascus destructans 20631-21]
MLLPALCPPPRRAPLPPSLFASPPASPSQQATSSHSALLATCHALQSMLASPQPQPQTQLPTPPMRHVPLPSPMKLRLRSSTSRPSSSDASAAVVAEAPLPVKPIPRKRIVKRAPPRGAGKRRRGVVEEEEEEEEEEGPRTPKRSRGYRSEGVKADALGIVGGPVGETSEVVEEGEGDEGEWTNEEDRVLVELVLQKLRLSRREWMDCAKMVGRDRRSVGRRWSSLVGGGEVGLKRRGRERAELPGTWR